MPGPRTLPAVLLAAALALAAPGLPGVGTPDAVARADAAPALAGGALLPPSLLSAPARSTAARARAAAPRAAAPRAAAARPRAAAPRAAAPRAAAARPRAAAPRAAGAWRSAAARTAARRAPARLAPRVRQAPTGCDGRSGWRERRAATAVRAVGLAPADLGYRLQVLPARRGLLGEAVRSSRTVVLHVRTCAQQSDADLAWVLAHELAHALDFSCDDRERRRAWLDARAPGASYWPAPGAADDLASGAGDFAEVFALARTGHRAMWASRLSTPPSVAELAHLAPLLRPTC